MIDPEKYEEEMILLEKYFRNRGLSKIEVKIVCRSLVDKIVADQMDP